MAKRRTGYLEKRGKVYYACWTVDGRKFKRSTHKTDAREAQGVLDRIMEPFLVRDEMQTLQGVQARIEGAKAQIAAIEEQRHPPTKLRDAWDAFVRSPERPDSGDATMKQYGAECRRFVEWAGRNDGGPVFLRDVTEEMAAEYARDLGAAGFSASTFNQHVGFFRLLWRVLRREAKLAGDPWEGIRRRKAASVSRRELTLDELRRVCMSAKGEMRLLFALGIYTGMRLGDCATLRWGEVDTDRRVIHRVPMKVARRNPAPVYIPIHDVLLAMLGEIPPPRRRNMVMPRIATLYERDSSALSKQIRAHFEKNEIRTRSGVTQGRSMAAVEVGFHSLRHTFVSLCRTANAPLAVVEAIVGHNSPAMTRHYTHVSETAAGQAVALLPSVVADKNPPALPSAKAPALLRIHKMIEDMTAKNWRKVRMQLLDAMRQEHQGVVERGIST